MSIGLSAVVVTTIPIKLNDRRKNFMFVTLESFVVWAFFNEISYPSLVDPIGIAKKHQIGQTHHPKQPSLSSIAHIMTENKHFLQPRRVGSVEKHLVSIPPSNCAVELHQWLHKHDWKRAPSNHARNNASKPTTLLICPSTPLFSFFVWTIHCADIRFNRCSN